MQLKETEEKNSNDKQDIIEVHCFVCNNTFNVNTVDTPSDSKTLYCRCPKCNTELKIDNPNYKND